MKLNDDFSKFRNPNHYAPHSNMRVREGISETWSNHISPAFEVVTSLSPEGRLVP